MVARQKKLRFFKPALIIFIVIVLSVAIKYTIFQPKPNIAVDYLSQYNELTKPVNYDPKQNSADLFYQSFDVFKEMPEELESKFYDYENDLYLMSDDLDAEKNKLLSQWLDSNDEAFDLALKACRKPYYWYELNDSDNNLMFASYPNNSEFSEISKAVEWLVKVKVEKDPSAILMLRHNLRLSDQLANTGAMIKLLIAQDIRDNSCLTIRSILSHVEINSEILAELQRYIENSHPEISIEKQLSTESLAVHDCFQRIYTDNGDGDGRIIPVQYKNLMQHPEILLLGNTFDSDNDGLLDKIKRTINNAYDEIQMSREIASTSETRKEAESKLAEVYQKTKELCSVTPYEIQEQGSSYMNELYVKCGSPSDYPVAYWFMKSNDYLITSSYVCKCKYEATATVLAILRYKQDSGNLPKTLDVLVEAGYLKKLPMDPFSSEPLVYRLTGDDFLLYSFGRDFNDDNGKNYKPWESNEGDFVFWPVPEPKKIIMPGMMPGVVTSEAEI